MPRPKGSKNKPKDDMPFDGPYVPEDRESWLPRKVKRLLAAQSVEKPAKKERKKKIRSTITSQSETMDSSSGEVGVEPVGKRVIKGYVNIQKGGKFFYTGGDIHATEELAKRVANKQTVATIFVAFEV